jgi:hypothetical protein
MNADYLQALRYKLQRRFRRLNSTGFQLFHFGLRQFWTVLQEDPFLRGILDTIDGRCGEIKSEVDKLISGRQPIGFDTEKETVLASYIVVKHCAESSDQRIEERIGGVYGLLSGRTKSDEHLESFKDIFLEPLYEFLDESLDDKALILSLLIRYKRRCEWFERDRLFKTWSENTQRGEKHLALDLYEYLFDQGINFQIEPTSASGEADLVKSQAGEEPLIADAKIFCPEKGKGKSYVAAAFNQLYIYTLDFNEPYGFLIIFKTCEESLHFALPEKAASAPFLTHNNKTVFFVVIDLFPHDLSASKRGQLRSIEITDSDLIKVSEEPVKEESPSDPPG